MFNYEWLLDVDLLFHDGLLRKGFVRSCLGVLVVVVLGLGVDGALVEQ